MTIENYVRKMGSEGYYVLGETDEIGWEPSEFRMAACKELKISLDDSKFCKTWEQVVSKIDAMYHVYWLDDIEDIDHKREFEECLPEILSGKSDVFRVVGFRMEYDSLEIIITEKDGVDHIPLYFDDPDHLELKFIGTRTKLGFTPTYKVRFNSLAKSHRVVLEEDSGYRKRLISFTEGEMEIMEYADI